jgi:hypothetical protein
MKKQNAILTFTFITLLGVALLVSVLAIVDLDSTIIEQRKTINQHEHEAELLNKKIRWLEGTSIQDRGVEFQVSHEGLIWFDLQNISDLNPLYIRVKPSKQ